MPVLRGMDECVTREGNKSEPSLTLKSLFYFLIGRLKPPNQKIKKSFSTSEKAWIRGQRASKSACLVVPRLFRADSKTNLI